MAEIARDSGICVDNDSESLSSATSSNHNLSYVQRLRKRFECLAKEQELEFHEEVNWWLEDEARVNEQLEDGDTTDGSNTTRNLFVRLPLVEHEDRSYSKQSSVKSQISHDSNRGGTKLIITPATPVKSPSTPKEFPIVTFSDYQENNETNDTDSFDSESEQEEVEPVVEEVTEDAYIRRSNNTLRLSRPVSITSQTSK